ncbi:hypothetical protein BGZ73_004592 [Actinomortierella ambigua]|nr:hypothetical protein BGZ73_004592 [Actinomortierella ambigua]
MLTLFKDNEHMFPIKTFDLADCYEVQVKSADTKGTTRFEFKLVTRKEETWFGTDTMMERTGWIDALNNLMTAKGANVGTSLSKLEAKLNTIRHRNNSHEYTSTTPPSSEFHPHKRQISAGPAFGSASSVPITSTPSIPTASLPHAGIIEEQLQIMQQELQTREQVLSKRELEIEQKRIESLLVQLKAWRGASKVTVNQQYAVRDQLLDKFMKSPRTVQDLVDRAKIHLDAGADQIGQVITAHWDCLTTYDAGGGLGSSTPTSGATNITILGLHRQLFRELKQVLLDLTINLDTRSSEIQRALLVVESHLVSFSHRDKRGRRRSGSFGSTHSGSMTPEQSTPGPPLSSSASAAAEESIKSIRRRYTDTLEALKALSQKIKTGLNRPQLAHHEVDEPTMVSFREEMRDQLKTLRLPTLALVSCIPDQPLIFNPLTGQHTDPSVTALPMASPSSGVLEERQDKADPQDQPIVHAQTPVAASERPASALSNKEAAGTPAPSTRPPSFSPLGPRQSPFDKKETPTSRPISMVISPDTPTDSSSLPLPKGVSSFLLSQASSPTLTPAVIPTQPPALPALDSVEMTQKMRDLVMPEFDHLSAKQQETLKSLTTLLNDLSNGVMAKLGEIKEASQAQRQEFGELKDEIIDVMQLSATDPSNTQRDMSALSDIRSKLADITNQLTTAQKGSSMYFHPNNNSNLVLGGGAPGATPGLQRSMSTMVHHPSGHFSQYQTVDGSFRGRLPESTSMVASGPGSGLDSVYGRASAFGHVLGGVRSRGGPLSRVGEQDAIEGHRLQPSPEVVSKLDHLLLLLEFVNTAQCRLMAYQELEHERRTQAGHIDDGRMMAVQEHMVEMDRKMNLQMSLLGRLLHLQDSSVASQAAEDGAARLTEIQDDGEQAVESAIPSSDRLRAEHNTILMSPFPDPSSTTDSLTLTQLLERLEIDLIPSFRAQEERVQELSGHITDLQKQIQEQQQQQQQQQHLLQQQQHNQMPQRSHSSASRHRILTNDSTSARAGTPQSPMETESPALWRASLRPSQSNGSTIAKEKRATLAHCASSPSLPGSSSSSTSTSSLVGLATSPLMTPSMSYKTSDRILEIVERLEARLDKITPPPEGSDATTKGQGEEEHPQRQPQALVEQIQEVVQDVRADNKALLQDLRSLVTEQMDQHELTQVGQKALLKEIMTSLTELHGHRAISSQTQQQWLKEVKTEMETILRTVRSTSNSREPSTSMASSPITVEPLASSSLTSGPSPPPPMVVLDASEAVHYWKEPLQKVQDMLVAESDRAEASWNEHRDEVAMKVETILSRLDDTDVSRDGELTEGLAEMREWIVRHSAMQTENLRSMLELMVAEIKAARQERDLGDDDNDDDSSSNNSRRDTIENEREVGHTSLRSSSSVAGNQAQNTKSTPSQPLQQQDQLQADKFQELRDQLEMSSRVQMATFSEMADNLTGVEKMIRDMSQMMGVRRGGTLVRKREQEASRAMLAMEVKETIQEMIGSSASLVENVSPTTSGPPASVGAGAQSASTSGSSGFGGLFGGSSTSSLSLGRLSSTFSRGGGNSSGLSSQPAKDSRRASEERSSRDSIASVDRDRESQKELQVAISLQQQQHQWLESRVEELQTRKVRMELQVGQLEQDKAQLEAEKAQLAHEVELLRRERQTLLLSDSHHDNAASDSITKEKTTIPRRGKPDPFEGMLVDRVSMLLQETARLEALRRQLDYEVHARLGSRSTSSLTDNDERGDNTANNDDNEHDHSAANTVEVGEIVGATEDDLGEDLVLMMIQPRLASHLRQRLTQLLIPVCNDSESHAAQELKWLWQHARDEASKSTTDAKATAKKNKTDDNTSTLSEPSKSQSDIAQALLEDYVQQRVQERKPLQYILGTQPFLNLEILTRPPTLIPRWETEEWTHYLAIRISASLRGRYPRATTTTTSTATTTITKASKGDRFSIADLCTGSGCIALGLASNLPPGSTGVLGVDLDKRAVQLARDNLAFNRNHLLVGKGQHGEKQDDDRHHQSLQSNTVRFEQLDLWSDSVLDDLDDWSPSRIQSDEKTWGYNLVVSNPPYIDPEELATLEPEVRQWEDPKALIADQQGLAFYPRIASIAAMVMKAPRTQRNGPIVDQVEVPELVLEIGGDHQVHDVTTFVRKAGFTRIDVWKDLAERARCIVASR